jgi:hypothetical protein
MGACSPLAVARRGRPEDLLGRDAHVGLRDAGTLPTRRAFSFHTFGPPLAHGHTCGQCARGGPPVCVSRPRALGGVPSKTMSFGNLNNGVNPLAPNSYALSG